MIKQIATERDRKRPGRGEEETDSHDHDDRDFGNGCQRSRRRLRPRRAAQRGPVRLFGYSRRGRSNCISARFHALRAVDLKVYGGSIHSVIGPNGAGKSSLLKLSAGFYRPQSGAVLFNGQDINRRSPHSRASAGIGRTFQGIQTYPSMTVRENILAGLHVHMRTGLIDALLYWPRTRGEEQRFKSEAEEIIEFLSLRICATTTSAA